MKEDNDIGIIDVKSGKEANIENVEKSLLEGLEIVRRKMAQDQRIAQLESSLAELKREDLRLNDWIQNLAAFELLEGEAYEPIKWLARELAYNLRNMRERWARSTHDARAP